MKLCVGEGVIVVREEGRKRGREEGREGGREEGREEVVATLTLISSLGGPASPCPAPSTPDPITINVSFNCNYIDYRNNCNSCTNTVLLNAEQTYT